MKYRNVIAGYRLCRRRKMCRRGEQSVIRAVSTEVWGSSVAVDSFFGCGAIINGRLER